jgi:HAT1-interacting factor 1
VEVESEGQSPVLAVVLGWVLFGEVEVGAAGCRRQGMRRELGWRELDFAIAELLKSLYEVGSSGAWGSFTWRFRSKLENASDRVFHWFRVSGDKAANSSHGFQSRLRPRIPIFAFTSSKKVCIPLSRPKSNKSSRDPPTALTMAEETIAAEPLPPMVEDKSAAVAKIEELIKKAKTQYALKNFCDAADLYSDACELQDQVNGEMVPENAELLFLYGRALFRVAVSKSDVLGGQVAGEKKKEKSSANGAAAAAASTDADALATGEEKIAEEVIEAAVEAKGEPRTSDKEEKTVGNQPYFQITGMENWDSDEDEDADEGAEGEPEEEEDEFAMAYEILDMARVLLEKQLNALKSELETQNGADKGKGKAEEGTQLSPEERHIKERLSDIHDLEAEVALENERFLDAIPETRASLELKQELYPQDHNLIAEGHFKLSLALEFAAVTKIREAQAQEGANAKVSEADVDEEMRGEAREQMELAITSCRMRLAREEQRLEGLDSTEREKQLKAIAEVKEIIEEMETRVSRILGHQPTYTQLTPRS